MNSGGSRPVATLFPLSMFIVAFVVVEGGEGWQECVALGEGRNCAGGRYVEVFCSLLDLRFSGIISLDYRGLTSVRTLPASVFMRANLVSNPVVMCFVSKRSRWELDCVVRTFNFGVLAPVVGCGGVVFANGGNRGTA